jgi:hypothetical protein
LLAATKDSRHFFDPLKAWQSLLHANQPLPELGTEAEHGPQAGTAPELFSTFTNFNHKNCRILILNVADKIV